MIVNISYSIEFDEVPKVVRGFLENDVYPELSGEIIQAVSQAIVALDEEEENTAKATQKIDLASIQEDLGKLVQQMKEVEVGTADR